MPSLADATFFVRPCSPVPHCLTVVGCGSAPPSTARLWIYQASPGIAHRRDRPHRCGGRFGRHSTERPVLYHSEPEEKPVRWNLSICPFESRSKTAEDVTVELQLSGKLVEWTALTAALTGGRMRRALSFPSVWTGRRSAAVRAAECAAGIICRRIDM